MTFACVRDNFKMRKKLYINLIMYLSFAIIQFDDNVYQARRNAHRAIEMCVHMSPGTEGVVDAKLVPVLVGKLLKEEDEIKVCTRVCYWVKLPVSQLCLLVT